MLYGVIPGGGVGGGGGGVTKQSFRLGGPIPRGNPHPPPLTLLYTIFDRKRDTLYLKLQRKNKE